MSRLVLQMERAKILWPPDLSRTPDWAKPIIAAAIKLSQASWRSHGLSAVWYR